MEDLVRELAEPGGKLVLLVMDGLGGLPHPETGRTELETARTPNLDALARKGSLGLHDPVAPGITPGSGPGHLGLFGYDPVENLVGRGVLSALGVGMELEATDVAARINFASKKDGKIVDRRAGRIPTEECVRLTDKLSRIRIPRVEILVRPEMQHRAVVVFRGQGLSPHVTDSDPQQTGVPPLKVEAREPGAASMAELANRFVEEVDRALADEWPANTVLLRGFDRQPDLPSFPERYGVNPAVIAVYPMYRGLARLVGMKVLDGGHGIAEEFDRLEAAWSDFDFFFVHVKPTDSAGEDGDFDRKVRTIEEVDAQIPRLLKLDPAAVLVTGDHSTPATFKAHTWHPVPFLIHSRWSRWENDAEGFGERACSRGQLGRVRAKELMPLLLAHAGRLAKFGA
ncbi:2,3-bisphosphoglycerate-independent phosphoglycerate mutase [Limnochorda pilosa]|uniref:Phosphoglycerate mutase n=1 Tax=Limnochorda pilosa TaxID=1555112 RepID=A0A0K2SN46_LIMPI|nr:2,3-bisphosphoglycerate-independent phosphoglycerate mutase [Limnochorda pilosa]BAS28536.1 phosphoglycerate mutase [Limnochorda pilosa]